MRRRCAPVLLLFSGLVFAAGWVSAPGYAHLMWGAQPVTRIVGSDCASWRS